MTPTDDLDARMAERMKVLFDHVRSDVPPFRSPVRRRRRASPRLLVAISLGIVLVAAPAGAVTVHHLLAERAFTDMGVHSTSASSSHHLVLTSAVSRDLTIKLYRSDVPARADGGKTGNCVFAESVVNGVTSGGKGYCFSPTPGPAPALSSAQYVIVELPDGDTSSAIVTATRGSNFRVTSEMKEGFVVLPHLPPGPLELTYRVAGVDRRTTVDVPG